MFDEIIPITDALKKNAHDQKERSLVLKMSKDHMTQKWQAMT